MNCASVGNANSTTNTDTATDGTPTQSCATSETKPELLPGPFAALEASGDVGAQIAALIVRSSYDQKEAARQARASSEAAQRAAEDQELADMKEEADKKLCAGIMSGGTQIAAGSMNMDSGNGYATASAKITEGLGKLGSANFDHEADAAARGAKRDEQIAGREKMAVDDARDLDKDAKEMLDRALSYYKEYLTAKSDTMHATLLRA